jgi:radical SAM protein with 4Fe4S-binding SPASM domain
MIHSLWDLWKLAMYRSMDIWYDNICFPRKNLSSTQVRNYFISRIHSRLGILRPDSFPIGLQLEPTVRCQLSCPLCPRLRMSLQAQDPDMNYDNYLRLMNEISPYILAIAFWQWGEPLLHPRITEMVALAHQKNILSIISTNGQASPDEFDIKGLFAAGLGMLIISIDGIDQEQYDSFRKGGDVSRTLHFAETACRIKRESGMITPLINIRIIATSETETEIPKVREFAKTIGADVFSVKALSMYYDADPDTPILPVNRDYRSFQYQGKKEAEEYDKMQPACNKPWSWPTLLHDGMLLICECDHQSSQSLGNVFTEGFKQVWTSRRSADIRNRFPELEFCQRCRYKYDDAMREVTHLKK